MADQVNPMGGLALGMAQAAQALTFTPAPLQPLARPVESKPKPKTEEPLKEDASKETLEAAVKTAEGFLQSATDLRFGVDKVTGDYIVKIIDPNTHETIRQMPSEEVLAMARRLRELGGHKDASGILMDKEG
jgi:flagellar protein FlaG